MPTSRAAALFFSLGLTISCISAANTRSETDQRFGLGRAASEAEIQSWDIDVAPSGAGLRPGRGTAKEGAAIYAAKCAGCHGATGTEGPMPRLVGGHNTLATERPLKTVGSYWPYATTIYDYVHRAMPYNAPQSLSPDETYAVTAWLLFQNGLMAEEAVLDARTLPGITMPNRNGFVSDPRPDVPTRTAP